MTHDSPGDGGRESGEEKGGVVPPRVSQEAAGTSQRPKDTTKGEAAAHPAIPPIEKGGAYDGYLVLVRKPDQKYADRGELDPLTWQEVDAQICEDPRLSRGQMRLLHDHCRNRLKLAGGGWG